MDSTLMTSAPMAARYWVANGPAQKAGKAMMRRPARGRPPAGPAGAAGEPARWPGGRAGDAAPLRPRGRVRAQPRRRCQRAEGRIRQPVRRSGLHEAGSRMRDEGAAGDEVVEARDRLAGADGGYGNAQGGGPLDDLGDRVPPGPAMDQPA